MTAAFFFGAPGMAQFRQRILTRNPVAQCFAVDIRHDVERLVVDHARIVQRQNVRMVKAGYNFYLPAEAADAR